MNRTKSSANNKAVDQRRMAACRVLYMDWPNTSQQTEACSFMDTNVLHEYDVIFFDPLCFIEGLGIKYSEEDAPFDVEIDTPFVTKYLKGYEQRSRQLRQFLNGGGLLVVRFNIPTVRIRLRERDHSTIYNRTRVSGHRLFLGFLKTMLLDQEWRRENGHTCIMSPNRNAFTKRVGDLDVRYKMTLAVTKSATEVLATNRGHQPIMVAVGDKSMIGKVLFIPHFETEDETTVLREAATDFWTTELRSETEPAPAWLDFYVDRIEPLAGVRKTMDSIREQQSDLNRRLERMTDEENSLKKYGMLLFESGKFTLEPVVRTSLRILGFEIPEPDSGEYHDDYDFHIKNDDRIVAVGEVEGKLKSALNIEKFRQLIHRVTSDKLPPKTKGILVGNAHRREDPRERKEWFSQRVMIDNETQKFCLLSTYELFKAVVYVLNNSTSESIEETKLKIRESILDCETEYKFVESNVVA